MTWKWNIYNWGKKIKLKRLHVQGHCKLILKQLLSCVTETISFYAYHEFVFLSIRWEEQYFKSEIDFNKKWHFRKEFRLEYNRR